MVFEYTEAEKQRLIEIEERYAKLQDDLSDEIKKHKEGSKAYNDCLARWIALDDQHYNELSALYAECEQARFDALGGDLKAIYADAKKQVKQIIETTYDQRKQVAIEMNASGAFDKVQNENPLIESRTAAEAIRNGLRLHLEALETDKGQLDRLNKYIHKYISTSPYVYVDTSRKEAPEDEATALEPRLTKIPDFSKYGLMKDKINKVYIPELPTFRKIDGQLRMEWRANQAGDNRPPVPVYFALSPGENVTTTQRIDAQDEAILNAVSNIIIALKTHGIQPPYNITLREIWRQMNGGKGKLSDVKDKEYCQRIDKMRHSMMYMDMRKEMEANFAIPDDERIREGVVEDYYLPARKIYAKTEKGREAAAYSFYDLPFIYAYNMAKGHIIRVDYDLLDTSDTTGNEGYTVVFRNYLLREIAMMYSRERDNNKIKYATLYHATATPTPEERANRSDHKTENAYQSTIKKEAKRDRDKVLALLQSWKNKGWIKDFEQYKDGRSYAGVEIKLNPKNYEKRVKG